MENFHTLDKIDHYKEAKLIEIEIADEQKKKKTEYNSTGINLL